MEEALAILGTALVSIGEGVERVTLHLSSSMATKWLMPRIDPFAARFPAFSLTTEVHEQNLASSFGRNEIATWPDKVLDANPAHGSPRLADNCA
jgi:LysR family glycine cleavage system transcriptional activator